MDFELFKDLEKADTPAEMRTAIERGAHNNQLIYAAFMMARRDRVPAVDTYSVLAYYALQQLAATQRAHLKMIQSMPLRPILFLADGQMVVPPL